MLVCHLCMFWMFIYRYYFLFFILFRIYKSKYVVFLRKICRCMASLDEKEK